MLDGTIHIGVRDIEYLITQIGTAEGITATNFNSRRQTFRTHFASGSDLKVSSKHCLSDVWN